MTQQLELPLKEFAQKHLMPESKSTNPSHRRFLAFSNLDELSDQLSQADYDKCWRFIDSDFDLSIF